MKVEYPKIRTFTLEQIPAGVPFLYEGKAHMRVMYALASEEQSLPEGYCLTVELQTGQLVHLWEGLLAEVMNDSVLQLRASHHED